jgi:O-antigen/teichoic acid export membrane protein
VAVSQATANVRWVGISQAARVLIQIVSVAVLSRLLPPSDYGIMALAAVVTNFAGLFRDMGTASAVVQRKDLSQDLMDAIFWFNVCFGLVIGLIVAAAAPVAARIFHAPTLFWVLLAMAPVFPIAGWGSPLLALMERNNAFREIAWIEASSAAMGLAAAVAAALLGAGVYSLVLQFVVTVAVSAVELWRRSHWTLRLSCNFSELRSIWKFSSNLMLFNLINYFSRNSDSMIIGRTLGTVSLGLYSLAYRILLFPLQNLTFVISRALLPIYSRRQNDLGGVGVVYLKTLKMIAMVSAPVMFGLWALRKPFVAVVFGSKWGPVADILAWFAPMGFFHSLNSTVGSILSAIDRTDLMRKLGFVNTGVLLASFFFGLHYGLIGLVVAYFIASVAVTLWTLEIVLRQVKTNLLALIVAIWRPVACSAVIAIIVNIGVLKFEMPEYQRLILFVPLGAGAYLGLLYVFAQSAFADLRSIVMQLSNLQSFRTVADAK